jgi:hypothetical protein
VLEDEKISVEKRKIIPAQAMAGSQFLSLNDARVDGSVPVIDALERQCKVPVD